MDISIKMDGFDKIQDYLQKMQDDVEPDGLAKWAETLESTAKKICNDPDCKRIKFKVESTTLKWEFKDSKAIECMLKSIEQHYNTLSLGLQGFSKIVKEKLEKQQKDMEESNQ